jgi:hypothetical protein
VVSLLSFILDETNRYAMSARYTCPLTVVISEKSAHFNKLSFISMEWQMEKSSKSSESLL